MRYGTGGWLPISAKLLKFSLIFSIDYLILLPLLEKDNFQLYTIAFRFLLCRNARISPSGANHPPGLVRFLLTQKMRKCFHFRKSSFTDPFFASNKIWAKNLLYQYLIIQAASDACASYLHKQMLHNAVASSVKAGGKMKHGLRRMKQSFGLWSSAWQRHEAKTLSVFALRATPWQAGFMFFCLFKAKKWLRHLDSNQGPSG